MFKGVTSRKKQQQCTEVQNIEKQTKKKNQNKNSSCKFFVFYFFVTLSGSNAVSILVY